MIKHTRITYISVQDCSYLGEVLLAMGYEAHRLKCRALRPNTQRIAHV
ncbi:hypothetical protein ACPOLB_11835 [Rubrivivax sp. RP6-9]